MTHVITQPPPRYAVAEAQRLADQEQRDYAVIYVASDPACPWMPWPADDVEGHRRRTGERCEVRMTVRPTSSWLSVDSVADAR